MTHKTPAGSVGRQDKNQGEQPLRITGFRGNPERFVLSDGRECTIRRPLLVEYLRFAQIYNRRPAPPPPPIWLTVVFGGVLAFLCWGTFAFMRGMGWMPQPSITTVDAAPCPQIDGLPNQKGRMCVPVEIKE